MPRTRVQQDQHNERRRLVKQEGRKAIFCKRYIHAKYPEIHDEACEFFDKVNERYPGKRDLCKTHEFKSLKESPGLVELEPHLRIPLMPNNTILTPTTTTTEEEIPPVIDSEEMESEEIKKIIDELRQDPDLASIFNDIELPPVSAYLDLQLDFQALGEDLPELDQEIDW